MKIEINIGKTIGKMNINQKIVVLITILAISTVLAWMPFVETESCRYYKTAFFFNIVGILFSGASWFLRFRDEHSDWVAGPGTVSLFYLGGTFFVTIITFQNCWSGWSHGMMVMLNLTLFVIALIIYLIVFVNSRNGKIEELNDLIGRTSDAVDKMRLREALRKIAGEEVSNHIVED